MVVVAVVSFFGAEGGVIFGAGWGVISLLHGVGVIVCCMGWSCFAVVVALHVGSCCCFCVGELLLLFFCGVGGCC